jgi:hypothetical protein
MQKQVPSEKKRVPIQFYVEYEEKAEAKQVADFYGGLSNLARKGFFKELAALKRARAAEEHQEPLAS